jgi:hypothetical protein
MGEHHPAQLQPPGDFSHNIRRSYSPFEGGQLHVNVKAVEHLTGPDTDDASGITGGMHCRAGVQRTRDGKQIENGGLIYEMLNCFGGVSPRGWGQGR